MQRADETDRFVVIQNFRPLPRVQNRVPRGREGERRRVRQAQHGFEITFDVEKIDAIAIGIQSLGNPAAANHRADMRCLLEPVGPRDKAQPGLEQPDPHLLAVQIMLQRLHQSRQQSRPHDRHVH